MQHRYATRVDDVATEIAAILMLLESGAADVGSSRGAIFLAESSSDLDEARSTIRRSLVQRGYDVLPNTPLRLLTAPHIRETVTADLARVKASIHPIGGAYGIIPELAAGASIVRLQLELAAARDGDLRRLIWIPDGLQSAEPPQTELIASIRNEWAGNPFQLTEGPLQNFETNLLDTLERLPAPPPLPDIRTVKKRPGVYLITADDADRKSSRAVRFWLHEQGVDVAWPLGTTTRHRNICGG